MQLEKTTGHMIPDLADIKEAKRRRAVRYRLRRRVKREARARQLELEDLIAQEQYGREQA